MKKQYFCNPLNMDYRYQFIQDMRSGEDKISREAADPSMILFQGKYYIFASMTLSVWVSEDMVHWESHRLPESLPLYDLSLIHILLDKFLSKIILFDMHLYICCLAFKQRRSLTDL